MHLSPNGKIDYIEPLSPADLSGLEKDQKIIYINDVDVRDMARQNVVKLIEENINNLIVGVESETTEMKF